MSELVPRPDPGHPDRHRAGQGPEGFRAAARGLRTTRQFNDLESVRAAVNEQTAAVLVEAVQGEGGVVPRGRGLHARHCGPSATSRASCCSATRCSAALGRTGSWFGYQAVRDPARRHLPGQGPGRRVSHRRRSRPPRSCPTSFSRATTPPPSAAPRWPAPPPWP